MFVHNTLLAYKIATSMNNGDIAKQIIVEKILDFGINSYSYVQNNKLKKKQPHRTEKAPPPLLGVMPLTSS